MDKWLTLDEVALELKETEGEILNLASSGVIMLSWQPIDLVSLYEVDMSTGEPKYFSDDNPFPCNQPIDVIRGGYFEIDLTLSTSWKESLNNIKLGGKGYGLVFDPIDPLVVREVGTDGYIWSVTPPPELGISEELDIPTIQTLGVFDKELKRYIAQLKHVESKLKVTKAQQANIAFKQAIAKLDLSSINEENGKDGIPKAVWIAIQNTVDVNGGYLFSKKGEGRPDRKIFNQYWRIREK